MRPSTHANPPTRNVAEEAKSVTRQVENAKAFAIRQGWTVNDGHIFVDDGISGAEFERRPGHREKSSQRVAEAHTRLHMAGHVTGGRVFGYRNVDVFHGVDVHGRPLWAYVDLEIHEAEAAVVRRIFALYDAGYGLKRIAKILTAEQAPAPKPFRLPDGLSPLTG
jgi:Recombinase